GAVGMYGFSYQGMTQLYAAAQQPPALKALAPAMVGYDLYADWAYENGALPLQIGLGWALQLAAETARRQQDAAAYQALRQAAQDLPLGEAVAARPAVFQRYARDSFFHQWLDHPQPDGYWQGLQPDLTGVDLPMLHIGGWYDPYLRGDLRLYQQMVGQAQAPQALWIGPWGHLPWGRRVGALDFGPQADSPIDHLHIRWFDRFLKPSQHDQLGAQGGADPTVQLFVMGLNQWRGWPQWPRAAEQPLYLASTGLAGLRQGDGHLSPSPAPGPDPRPGEDLPYAGLPYTEDVIVHDPWRPVPSLGGHSGLPPGPFDRGAIDSRTDVLTYTTAPGDAELALVGTPTVTLYCRADAPSFDLSLVLSVVQASGRVINLCQGQGRIDHHDPQNPSPQAITLPLQAVAATVAAGDQLRLSAAAACFPAYAVNSGTGAGPGAAAQIDHRVITLAVCHGAGYPACLRVPVVESLGAVVEEALEESLGARSQT
ncbi:MAG TPA: CocE/NonD family hydrolase, partial [Nodosilinea sp.]|nr:CocE/NonD family hydrolase [Nodosilinea sp.]